MSQSQKDVDELTAHLNHQIVSPIAGLNTSLTLWNASFDEVSPEDSGRAETIRLIRKLIDSQILAIKAIADRMQSFRIRFKNKQVIKIDDLVQFIQKDSIACFTAFTKEIKAIEPQVKVLGSVRQFRRWDKCRRQGNQIRRMLENLAASHQILSLNIRTLSFPNIIELAFLAARDTFENSTSEFSDVIHYKPYAEETFIGDYDKLIEVFTNLIDNSAKYNLHLSQLRIEIVLKVRPVENLPGFIKELTSSKFSKYIFIEYCDNGPGIEREEWKSVFERGRRGRNAPIHDDSGMGYGLYYCRKVMRAHHGDIFLWYSRACEGFSSFYLFMPI